MKKLKPVMFVGTGSDVGKSVLNAGFCRIFMQDGYRPAPFKAQNMSLNSYATPEGLEIGRAQAVQAEASGTECRGEMNPVLLKPTKEKTAQVVLNGRPMGNQSAREYFNGTDRDMLFNEAIKAFDRLEIDYNPIVCEGAGSISEINLWDKDITNMKISMAKMAPTFLIADIDKGGVIASVYGSIKLLPEKERSLIKGIIINKFRGDISLFDEGKKIIEELTGIPVVGVIPYFRDIFIEQEDSVVIENQISNSKEGKLNIAVILLKHMSNFTDFNLLERHPDTHLYYSRNIQEIKNADIIILPGSKNTISDLADLRESGIAKTIIEMHEAGKQVYGICGGYQMMGKEITDPHHVEGDVEYMPGLSILPVKTRLLKEKRTEQVKFSFLDLEDEFEGYEIHMGESVVENDNFLSRIDGKPDGCFLDYKTWGTYIHGIFDNAGIVEQIINKSGIKSSKVFNFKAYKEENYNKLAELMRENLDMKYIYKTLSYD